MINIEIKESEQCNGKYSLFVSFEYNSDVIEIVKSFSTRVYNKINHTWELPFNQLGNLVNKLSEYDINADSTDFTDFFICVISVISEK